MPEFSAPFAGATSGKILSETEQRGYYSHLGDGIINARTNESGRLVADGTSVLRLNPTEVKLQGLYYSLSTTPKAFNLATIGTQPAAGQTRIDLLVWRLDTTAKTITAEVVPGLPATVPATPSFSRSGTVFEEDAWSWRWTGTGMQQVGLTDRRSWIGPHLYLAPTAPLPSDADIGSTASKGGVRWSRELVAGTASWVRQQDAKQVARTGFNSIFVGTPYDGQSPLVRQTFWAEPQIANTAGGWTAAYPEAFPNGVLSVSVTLANTVTNTGAPQVIATPIRANCTKAVVSGLARSNFTGSAVPQGQYLSVTVDALGW